MSAALRAEDIHARISWPAILIQLGVGEEFLRGKKKPGPCPACGGTDRFFFDNRTGHGDFYCRHCDAGDGFDLLQRVHRCDFTEARRRVMEAAGLSDSDQHADKPAFHVKQAADTTLRDWSTTAESIWRRTLPLRGSIGQVYLEHRGCMLPPKDSHLRFLAPTDKYPPSLCAAVSDARTAKPISLHFTRLAADGHGKAGTERDKLLLAGHRKKGGVIRLWPDEAVTYGLALAEGIESALAAAHLFAPVWAAIDASNMAAFPALNGIDSLTIFADHDDVGIVAARECARRWKESGREARIRRPIGDGLDLADLAARRVA